MSGVKTYMSFPERKGILSFKKGWCQVLADTYSKWSWIQEFKKKRNGLNQNLKQVEGQMPPNISQKNNETNKVLLELKPIRAFKDWK